MAVASHVDMRRLLELARLSLALALPTAMLALDERALLGLHLLALLPLASLWLNGLAALAVAASLSWLLVQSEPLPLEYWSIGMLGASACCAFLNRATVFRACPPAWAVALRPSWFVGTVLTALFIAAAALFRSHAVLPMLALSLSLLLMAWRLCAPVRVDVGRAALLAGVSLLCAVPLELTARRLFPPPPMPGDMFESHPEVIYWPKPGARTVTTFPPWGFSEAPEIPNRINNLGFRGEDFPTEKRPGVLRVLCLGDSYTYGMGVFHEHAYPAQLGSLLEARFPGRAIEVINAGVSGHGPWQARFILQQRGLPLRPDVVVMQTFLANDIGDTLLREGRVLESYHRETFNFARAFLDRTTRAYRVNRGLREACALYRVFEARITGDWAILRAYNDFRWTEEKLRPPVMQPIERMWTNEPDLCEWYPTLEEGWALMQQDLEGIYRDCKEQGIPLVAFNIPWNIDRRKDERLVKPSAEYCYELDKGNRIVEAFLQQQSDAFVPLMAALRAHPDPQALMFRWDGHFNQDGCRLLAEQVAAHLNPLIEKSPRPKP